ncbi:MAG: cytochrome c family protein [Pseudomonadota bacterium]
MKFLGNTVVSAFALTLLAACGGGSEAAETPTTNTEISDNNQSSTVEPSPSATAASAPATAPEVPSDVFAALPQPYQDADYARGRRTFKLCVSCHLLEEGAGHRVGPNLSGFFGREIGTAEGFAYSSALQEADFVWTPEQLEQWLANPRTFLPGNRMSFAGVRREDDRHAVIAYLMVETGWTPSEGE